MSPDWYLLHSSKKLTTYYSTCSTLIHILAWYKVHSTDNTISCIKITLSNAYLILFRMLMLQARFAFTKAVHVVTISTILNAFARNVTLHPVLNIVTLAIKHVDVNA